MKQLTVAIALIAALAGCSGGGGGKKILIMASGKLTVNDKDQKMIKLEPGTTHNEKEIDLEGGDDQTLTVEVPDGKQTFLVTGNGHYVLNLKQDTLVGGMVNYGTGGRTSNLTGEDVDNIIDSTQKLIAGQNASDDKKTYFITPFTLKKLSPNTESRIVGPYNNIPGSIDVDKDGKGPEMYKLYTTKQKRETLQNLIKERKK